MKLHQPYGSWHSPLSAAMVAESSVRLGYPSFDDRSVFWLERRPSEGGRVVVMEKQFEGEITERIAAPFSARSRVHEYGGLSYCVHMGSLFFVNASDQRIYLQTRGNAPSAITKEGKLRFGDLIYDATRSRLIAVCEDHSADEKYPKNKIVAISVATGEVTTLVEGNDFYVAPRLNPEAKKLAWVTWNVPNMPWDSTELWLADVDEKGKLSNKKKVVGDGQESVVEPKWSPDGTLFFITDRNGFWNIHCLRGEQIECAYEMPAEFSGPPWGLGQSTYDFISPNEIFCAFGEQGNWSLGRLNLTTKTLLLVRSVLSEVGLICVYGNVGVFLGASPTLPNSLITIDFVDNSLGLLKKGAELPVAAEWISKPTGIEFESNNGRHAYAFFYPPTNPQYEPATPEEKFPLVVFCHGGPTGTCGSGLDLEIQYWTSRGFGVVDVDYAGSTGYGTKFRQSLYGNWGIYDVEDCIAAAKHVCKAFGADEKRLAIRGGSAGGYTTLRALTWDKTFATGCSYFGVADVQLLNDTSHKFEAHYDSKLIGSPELYKDRSPIHHLDKLNVPLLLLQGSEDKVVPPSQAETMYEAVKAKKIPVGYLLFEGEDHGFRRKESIQLALESEFYFFCKVLQIPVDPEVEKNPPIKVDNLG